MTPRRRLRFGRHALTQLEEALQTIAEDDPAAAARLGDRIIERLMGLKTFPAKGRVVPELGDPSRREIIVAPYRIVYRIKGTEIRVLAVVHGRRLLEAALDEEPSTG
jgi:toxin ParE1/3/4